MPFAEIKPGRPGAFFLLGQRCKGLDAWVLRREALAEGRTSGHERLNDDPQANWLWDRREKGYSRAGEFWQIECSGVDDGPQCRCGNTTLQVTGRDGLIHLKSTYLLNEVGFLTGPPACASLVTSGPVKRASRRCDQIAQQLSGGVEWLRSTCKRRPPGEQAG